MTEFPDIFAALAAPFPDSVVKKRSHDNAKYITARSVMNRLDEVVGPEHWTANYLPWGEDAVVCTLTITLPDGATAVKQDVGAYTRMAERNTKADAGDDEKGGFSDALKRAAVCFGIGRHLYNDGIPKYPTSDAYALPPSAWRDVPDVRSNGAARRNGHAKGNGRAPVTIEVDRGGPHDHESEPELPPAPANPPPHKPVDPGLPSQARPPSTPEGEPRRKPEPPRPPLDPRDETTAPTPLTRPQTGRELHERLLKIDAEFPGVYDAVQDYGEVHDLPVKVSDWARPDVGMAYDHARGIVMERRKIAQAKKGAGA